MPAEALPKTHGRLVLSLSESIRPGPIQIRLSFAGRYSDEKEGIFQVHEGERTYVFTRFQPSFARRVFPGFDRPDLRTPLALSVSVPTGMSVYAGTPVANVETLDGQQWFHFKETRPIPLHLVGFAVGDFERVQLPSGTLGETPFRILTTHGKRHLTQYAAQELPKLFAMATDYFDGDYPDEKLDLISVPGLPVGAQEQYGLIFVRDELLLVDPAFTPLEHLNRSKAVLAHELAHVWMGSLVSPATWSDRWIFESFATFWSKRVVWQGETGWPGRAHPGRDLMHLLRLDATNDMGPIRQMTHDQSPSSAPGGGAVHGKGAALLRMYEHWLGSDAFRAGIRTFISKNAWQSVSEQAFFRSIDLATGQPLTRQSRWFINQAGAPWLQLELQCGASIQLKVEQKRDRLRRSKLPQGNPWSVPLCVRYGDGNQVQEECHRIDRRRMTVRLGTHQCPQWLYGNPGLKGYYRWSAPPSQMEEWLMTSLPFLSPLELSELPELLMNAHLSGRLSAAAFIRMVDGVVQFDTSHVVPGLIQMFHRLDRWQENAGDRRVLGRWFNALVETIESRTDSGASPEIDPVLQRLRLAAAFIGSTSPQSGTEKVAGGAHQANYWHGSLSDWQALKTSIDDTSNPVERIRLVGYLGHFNHPECLEQSLELIKEGTIRGHDVGALIRGVHRRNYRQVLIWLKAQEPSFWSALNRDETRALLRVFQHACADDDQALMDTIFTATESGGHFRSLKNTIRQRLKRCAHFRGALGSELSAELRTRGF